MYEERKNARMLRQVAWEGRPLSVVASDTVTTVSFRLLNATRRDQGVQLPHTFSVTNGIVVSNQVPSEVVLAQGDIVGRWKVHRMRWKPTPQNITRQSYETVAVAFEPDEGTVTGYARSTDILADVPHTFSLDDTTTVVTGGDVPTKISVSNTKPSKVMAIRGGKRCPCYGVWLVSKPLTAPQWGRASMALPWRKWNNRDQVVVEYEFFCPSSKSDTKWEDVAKGTVHLFTVAGIPVSRVPDEAYTLRSGRVVGRWIVSAPLLEGFEVEGSKCALHPATWWITFLLLLILVLAAICYLVRRTFWDPVGQGILVRVPITIRPLNLNE